MRVTIEIGRRDGGRLPVALLAYAVALAVLLLVPPYLKGSVGPPRAFTQQEAVDLLTPVVVLPLAWWILELTSGGLDRRLTVAFVVVGALWVEGQAIHLAANAIGDAFVSGAAANAFYATVPGDLDHWLDEVLSHWLWHIAWACLSALMLSVATIRTGEMSFSGFADAGGGRDRAASLLGGVVHGAVFFVVSVEGATTALGIPATLALLAWSALLAVRGSPRAPHPVVAFFLVSTVVTLVGYLGWGALNGWTLPEFSKVGLFS